MTSDDMQPANRTSNALREPASLRWFGTAAILSLGLVAGGYLLVWLGFSVLATTVLFALEQVGLMSSMTMWSIDPWLSAGVLLVAGVYQLTPLKETCLRGCRSPVQFISTTNVSALSAPDIYPTSASSSSSLLLSGDYSDSAAFFSSPSR